MIVRAALPALVVVAAACRPPTGPLSVDEAERRERWYRLSWHGQPVGWAVERESDDAISRVEHVAVRRGDAEVVTDLTIRVTVTADLLPRALRVETREAGATRTATAERRADGWHRDGASGVLAAPDAVPSELVPALVRMRGNFAGTVILGGWDLAIGDGVVVPAGDRRLAARTVVAGQAIDAVIELDERGNTRRIVDSTDTAAVRVASEAEATAPFAPIDVIAAAAIPLADDLRPVVIALAPRGPTRPPPALPGQRVDVDGRRWQVTLDPALPGALAPAAAAAPADDEIAELARGVHEAIEPSLAGNTAGAGDCTAYAVAFAAYAAMSGIPVQVVTGYVVDAGGRQLVRHRWNVAWTGSRWTTVDASQPDEMAPRLGLAVSDASVEGLTAAALADVVPAR